MTQIVVFGAASDGGQWIASRTTSRRPTLRNGDAPIQRNRRFHVKKTINKSIWKKLLLTTFLLYCQQGTLCSQFRLPGSDENCNFHCSFESRFDLFSFVCFFMLKKRCGCSTFSTRHSTCSQILVKTQIFTRCVSSVLSCLHAVFKMTQSVWSSGGNGRWQIHGREWVTRTVPTAGALHRPTGPRHDGSIDGRRRRWHLGGK